MKSPVLVDSNVLLDIVTQDKKWYSWSSQTLAKFAEDYLLAINPIIYAEVSIGFEKIEKLEAVLDTRFFTRLDLPWEAAFLAGKCFLKYRHQKGIRRSPLPDFFIGAHAAILRASLITRDRRRYSIYFPSVRIISP